MAALDLKAFNRSLLCFVLREARSRMVEFPELEKAATEVIARVPSMTDAEVETALDEWPRLAPSAQRAAPDVHDAREGK